MNIESSTVVSELLIMRPTKTLSEGIRNWAKLAEISVEGFEEEILVLIKCDVQEAQWIM